MTYTKDRMYRKPPSDGPKTMLEAYSIEADRLCQIFGVDGSRTPPTPPTRRERLIIVLRDLQVAIERVVAELEKP